MQTNPAQNSQPRSRAVKPVVVPSTQSAASGELAKSHEQTSDAARKPRMNRGNRRQASTNSDPCWGAASRSIHPAQ